MSEKRSNGRANGDESEPTRRRVLRASVASAAAVTGLAGSGSAQSTTLDPAASRPIADRAALDAIGTHGTGVLAALADDGHLDAASVDALADAGDGSTRATRRPDGTVRYETATGDGRLSVTVDPADGSQYAILAPDGDGSEAVTVFDPDATSTGPAACTLVTACVTTQDTCDTDYGCAEYTVACCDDGSCYLDGETGVRCACDICADGCSSVCP